MLPQLESPHSKAVSSHRDLTLGDKITTIGKGAFSGCTGFTSLKLPSKLTAIEDYTFYGCTGLTGNLKIPATVTTIGGFAFYDCSGLTGALNLPEGLTRIEDGTFYHCLGLTGALSIPEGVTFIGESAFQNCYNLDGLLTIPSTVTSIGENAFTSCRNLRGDVIIPEGLSYIGDGAFSYCQLLGDVYSYCTNPPSKRSDIFPTDVNIYVPLASGDAYRSAWSHHFSQIYEYGDANRSQSLTIADGVAITNNIVGAANTTFDEMLADVNSDSRISIIDATQVISAVLKATPSSAAASAARRAPGVYSKLVADNFILDADGSATVAMSLNADFPAVALQADIRGVNGLAIKGVELAPALAATHTLRSHVFDDGTVRVVIYSSANEAFTTNGEAIFTVAVSGNDGNIEASNIFASTPTADEQKLTFTGGENMANISGLGPDAVNQEVSVYAQGSDIVILGAEGQHVVIANAQGMLIGNFVADSDCVTRTCAPASTS